MSVHKSTRAHNRREFAQRIIDAIERAARAHRLPPLSANAKRLLLLRLRKLAERLGFAGGAHRRWPDSAEKRQEAARARRVPGEGGFYDLLTGKAIPSGQDPHDFVFARQNDVETIDLVGRRETATLIVGAYQEIAEAYFAIWRKTPDPHYDDFGTWLRRIELLTIAICRAEWPGRREWFDRMPLPDAAAQLKDAAAVWNHRAYDFEDKRRAEAEATATAPPGDRKGKRSKPPARGTPPPVLRPGHAAEIKQYKVKKGFTTDAQAARALGVGESVLKSIKSRRGRLRCSQETLRGVLDKIAKALNPPKPP
jgi:hypothetical protein